MNKDNKLSNGKNDKFKDIGKNLLIILLANTLCSIAINGFFIPNRLLSGGIGGISIMIQYLTGIPTGIMVFIINLPLFIYGFRKVDRTFAIYGSISMVTFSILLNLTSGLENLINIQDVLIGAIVGGVLNGIGVGLLFKNKMCQDGLDIIVTDIQIKYNIGVGTSLLTVNTIIVIVSSVLFELRLALYTIIGIYINSKMLDKVRVGLNTRKSVFIISDQGETLAEEIRAKIDRSVTFLEGMGSYKKGKKRVIYVVVNSNEIVGLKNIIDTVDPKAFTTISEVVEAKGSTFPNMDF